MKNQYVGDVNDFLKYGLLRRLQSVRKDPLFVCWMLTPDDQGKDGENLGYLEQAAEYCNLDPPLFDGLGRLVSEGKRSVGQVEQSGLLPNASFFSDLVPKAVDREAFAQKMTEARPPGSLVFFDPDNGLEVKKSTEKHVLWSDLEAVVGSSESAIVYQHNTRTKGGPDAYFSRLMTKAEEQLPNHSSFAVRGPHAGFLIIARLNEEDALLEAAREFVELWQGKLTLSKS